MRPNPKLFDRTLVTESGAACAVDPFTEVTLRDLFAATAPESLEASPRHLWDGTTFLGVETHAAALARARYEYADAMLNERAKGTP